MFDRYFESLNRFLQSSSSGTSQSEILKGFLYETVKLNALAESGSVLVHDPSVDKLYLFNDDNFLFTQNLLRPNEKWQEVFGRWEGIAGAAFARQQTEIVNDVDHDKRFTTAGVPLKSMVCVPIRLWNRRDPFGVASFHNDGTGEQFDKAKIDLIDTYVKTLALALQASPRRILRTKKVFIAHGHDAAALNSLKLILKDHELTPVVLKDNPKVGLELLDMLDDEIGKCSAGFVLCTGDDEGRKRAPAEETLRPRVRENVIFEAGYLSSVFRELRRVCFLVHEDVAMPSDLKGLLTERFDTIDNARRNIESVLEDWNLTSSRNR